MAREAGRSGLTLGEARVARLIAEGRSDEEIAEHLRVRVVEVEADLAALYHKLGVRSRTELALLIAPSSPPAGASANANRAAADGPGSSESTPRGHSEGRTTP
jgi:DNA-binding CsgD family transcriptional regulator